MTQIQNAVLELGMTVDDILQHFFLNGLNEVFRTQLVQLTNKIRPTLKEITDNFFRANEMYSVALKSSSKKTKSDNTVKSNVYAVNIEPKSKNVNPFINCTLCRKNGTADHGINRCTNYKSPKEKIARLKYLNGCDRCGNIDHEFSSCAFRF